MFLDVLRRRNPRFIEAAISLHQAGKLPANSYVLDLDIIETNAGTFKDAASKRGLKAFAMTKQVGRHSGFCAAVKRGGIDRVVAVDMACARPCHRAGLGIGHLGHLVQVPRHEATTASNLEPDYWTVFSDAKAEEAAGAAHAAGREQNLMARIQTEGDIFYRGHEGGFDADDIAAVADRLDALPGGRFAGVTTFPALLYDHETQKVAPTPNLATLSRAVEHLAKSGRSAIEFNAPGTTSSVVLDALADAGATQCEPGNGLHGTTPLHAMEDLPERPAVLYLTEVSHHHGGKAYCFGGGLYIDPVFPDYEVKALVTSEPTTGDQALASVEIPPPSAIDYYGMIDTSGPARPRAGDSVVFGFRGQAFVTRAFVAGIAGAASRDPKVVSIENGFGQLQAWPA
ncbi:MAG: alanine racemase [Geminicoccaceae bacterium]